MTLIMTLINSSTSRRSFLRNSILAGGGMVIGFNWLESCKPVSKEEMLAMPKEWFNINSYLKIGDNGVVTIFFPQS